MAIFMHSMSICMTCCGNSVRNVNTVRSLHISRFVSLCVICMLHMAICMTCCGNSNVFTLTYSCTVVSTLICCVTCCGISVRLTPVVLKYLPRKAARRPCRPNAREGVPAFHDVRLFHGSRELADGLPFLCSASECVQLSHRYPQGTLTDDSIIWFCGGMVS